MSSIISEDDREVIRRMVPKASNKIQAVAIARLYIAYPNRSKWRYTGLQGAVVLSNDLVGNTYWLKLVDISPSGRGVMWDQEIYESWSYNQDRTFFHTFEMEECLAGLSFADEKQARTFLKKMQDREKNSSKATKATPFGGTLQNGGHKHSLLGGIFGGHRHSSAPLRQPTPPESPKTNQSRHHNNRLSVGSIGRVRSGSEFATLDAIDPNWREAWGNDLRELGFTDELILADLDFIADYIREQKEIASSPVVAELNGVEAQRSRARPPPPPPAPSRAQQENQSPNTPSPSSATSTARRGVPPAPPAPRRSKAELVQREPTPPREHSPPRGPPPTKFAAPPPLPDAGKYARSNAPAPPSRPHASSISSSGPPPPPRPPKTPNDDYEPGETGSRFGVPPPFTGPRISAPPPMLARGPVPAPPVRDSSVSLLPHTHAVPPATAPQLPPKIPNVPTSSASPLPPSTSRPVPPPPTRETVPLLPPRDSAPPPPTRDAHLPPPLLATSVWSNSYSPSTLPPQPSSGAPPPPPPPPSTGAPHLPPPPLPSTSGPPPPPPPPPLNRDSGYVSGVPALQQPSGTREGVLAGIKQAGGIGALKKVDKSQIRDRSAAIIPGGTDTGPHGSGLPPAGATTGGGGGGLADALQVALNKRKQKVSASDDEEEDDDW